MYKIDYDRYVISDNGDIFDKKINRLLKPHKCAGGYFQVHLSGKRYYLHVIIAKKFLSNTESKPEVNHKDCNKANNHVSNLEWCTRKENMIHAHKMGHGPRRNAISLIDKVDKIREEYKKGDVSIQSIADKYGVSYTAIYNIIHRRSIIYS